MYKTSRELKQAASQSLSGKLGLTFGMFLIMVLIVSPFSFAASGDGGASVLASLIGTLLNIILYVGFTSFLLKLCCGQKEQAEFTDLFYGFKCHPGKAILLYLLTALYLLPGAVIYGVSIAVFLFGVIASTGITIMDFAFNSFPYISPSLVTGLILGFILITLLFIIYATYISTTYKLVYLLLLDYPDLTVGQIWKRSAQLMRGNRLRLVKLMLSFAPAIFGALCLFLLTAAIPVIMVFSAFIYFAYIFYISIKMDTASVHFYLDLVQNPHSDTNMTHECETAHDNIFDETEKRYTGIDPDTFK